eukprot:3845872-Amphidinium_carterae.2
MKRNKIATPSAQMEGSDLLASAIVVVKPLKLYSVHSSLCQSYPRDLPPWELNLQESLVESEMDSTHPSILNE